MGYNIATLISSAYTKSPTTTWASLLSRSTTLSTTPPSRAPADILFNYDPALFILEDLSRFVPSLRYND